MGEAEKDFRQSNRIHSNIYKEHILTGWLQLVLCDNLFNINFSIKSSGNVGTTPTTDMSEVDPSSKG